MRRAIGQLFGVLAILITASTLGACGRNKASTSTVSSTNPLPASSPDTFEQDAGKPTLERAPFQTTPTSKIVRGVSRSSGSASKIEGARGAELGWAVDVALQPWRDEAGVVHQEELSLSVYSGLALTDVTRQLPQPGTVIDLLIDESMRPPFAQPSEVLSWRELGYRRMQIREVEDPELRGAASAGSRPIDDPALGRLVPNDRRPRSYRARRPAGYELVVPAPAGPPEEGMLVRARKEVTAIERDSAGLARAAALRTAPFGGRALRGEQLVLETLRVHDDTHGATAYFKFGPGRAWLEVSLRDGQIQSTQVVD